MFILVPGYSAQAVTSSTTPAKTTDNSGYDSIKDIGKTIEKNTPNFITKFVLKIVDFLEKFRVNTFNHKFIFYPVLVVFLYFILRFVLRLLFP